MSDNVNVVRASLKKKFSFEETQPDKDILYQKYHKHKNLDEARAAGDVQGMLHFKRAAKREANKSVMVLSNEFYQQYGIATILREIKTAEKTVASTKELKEALYNREYEAALAAYSKRVTNSNRLQEVVQEHMNSWEDESYKQVSKDYDSAKRRLTALSNAKLMYIEDNKALIEAEKQRVQREELLSSGLLEDLGIVTPNK